MSWAKPKSMVGFESRIGLESLVSRESLVSPGSLVSPESLGIASHVLTNSVPERPWLRAVRPGDLDAIAAIEDRAYAFPWTLTNFADSIVADYDFWAIESSAGILAYALVMWLPEEAHLLNITVDPERQGLGLGRNFLTWILKDVQARGADSLMLEVRVSNPSALSLYLSLGFTQIGIRKSYYPSWNNTREDALVLSKTLLA
jgi:[ribosomal protein S18]-alanine N-acetyltransferase